MQSIVAEMPFIEHYQMRLGRMATGRMSYRRFSCFKLAKSCSAISVRPVVSKFLDTVIGIELVERKEGREGRGKREGREKRKEKRVRETHNSTRLLQLAANVAGVISVRGLLLTSLSERVS